MHPRLTAQKELEILEKAIRALVLGVALVFASASAYASIIHVDPDAFAANTVLNNAFAGITLTALGSSVTSSNVYSRTNALATTGTRVFGYDGSFDPLWLTGLETLRVDFGNLTDFVSIDFVANNGSDDCLMTTSEEARP